MSLLRVPPSALEAIARSVSIVDHRTGATLPWVPHTEQTGLWQTCFDHDWVFAAKPRRMGGTVAVELDDMVWTLLNDSMGDRVRAGLFVDTDEKSKERVAFAASVVEQRQDLFKGVDVNSERMLCPRGSVLEFHTGSAKNAGRGGGYQRLHITELPFWQNDTAMAALLPSMSLTSQVIVETTIDVTGPNGIATQALWDDPLNRFHREFFSVEQHLDYRADPHSITEEEWAMCRKEGFADRAAAAWWLRFALPNLCQGNMHTLMREFPQTRAHLFASAAGLWIKRATTQAVPLFSVDCDGHPLHIYRPLEKTSGQIVIGVDVAKGVNRDSSVIAVVDKYDGFLCAMLHSNSILLPQLARAIRTAHDLFTVKPTFAHGGLVMTSPLVVPEVAVETNGVGSGPLQHARELGVQCVDVHLAGQEGRSVMMDVLLLAKESCESGLLQGPQALTVECRELHSDPQTGEWKGRKDGLVAYGHALRRARINPWKPPPKPAPKEGVIDGKAIVRALAGGQKTPGW